MILDHNSTATLAWYVPATNLFGPSFPLTQLATDTSTWAGVPTRTDSYTLNNGNANYTIDYTTYKARLITANDIAAITGNVGFDESTSTNLAWFYFDSNTKTQTALTPGSSAYAWLFDYTNTCGTFGCNFDDASNTGHWTATAPAGTLSGAWAISRSGSMGYRTADTATITGIRPVITILKNSL